MPSSTLKTTQYDGAVWFQAVRSYTTGGSSEGLDAFRFFFKPVVSTLLGARRQIPAALTKPMKYKKLVSSFAGLLLLHPASLFRSNLAHYMYLAEYPHDPADSDRYLNQLSTVDLVHGVS